LLAKRNHITGQVGTYKQQQGEAVYVPNREIELIEEIFVLCLS
jgi:chorismate mutase/prephenate dehydrogenase